MSARPRALYAGRKVNDMGTSVKDKSHVAVTQRGKRNVYSVSDPRAEQYLFFFRKLACGVSVAEAAKQTIGVIRGKITIEFYTGGPKDEAYEYVIQLKNGAVVEEKLVRGMTNVFRRSGEHTFVNNADPSDLPVSHAALAETARYSVDSCGFRELLLWI